MGHFASLQIWQPPLPAGPIGESRELLCLEKDGASHHFLQEDLDEVQQNLRVACIYVFL